MKIVIRYFLFAILALSLGGCADAILSTPMAFVPGTAGPPLTQKQRQEAAR